MGLIFICRFTLVCILLAASAGWVLSQNNAESKAGTLQRIKVHGKSLEGNLEGETADPDVSIYLPPGYNTSRNTRYPVVYLLHGYSGTDATWTGRIANVPQAMERAIASKTAREMIIVMPNAYTKYGGSMYSNSVTTGDWESYIAEDLVAYVDSHYRTIPDREGRGQGNRGEGGRGDGAREDGARGANRGRGFGNVNSALAAAWSPNPKNPPDYFDLPVKDGQPQPLIVAKWYANAPLVMVDQYVPNLKKYRALAGDVGLQDGLMASNKQLEAALVNSGVAYKFETYEGDHTNRIGGRIETKVLPFFSENLAFVPRKRR
jgi:enterochelin esterase-like enzyme